MLAGVTGSPPFFDLRVWRQLLRRAEFDDADEYLVDAIAAGGRIAVDELAASFEQLSADDRWCLLAGLPTDVPEDSRDHLVRFLTHVLHDPLSHQAHQAEALRLLGDLGVPGSETLIIEDLRSRSPERRSMAITWLAQHGGSQGVEPVITRVRVVLARPAQSGGRSLRPSAEALMGVLLLLRRGSEDQLLALRVSLSSNESNLSAVERAWLTEFWPGCLDPDLISPPRPDMTRVRAWARGDLKIDWPGWIDVPPELSPLPEDGFQLDA